MLASASAMAHGIRHKGRCRSQDSTAVDESLSAAADSGDPEAVFKVIEEHGQEFSESNVTNSFAALAKVADGKGLDEGAVHGHRSFQTLVGEMCGRACSLVQRSAPSRWREVHALASDHQLACRHALRCRD